MVLTHPKSFSTSADVVRYVALNVGESSRLVIWIGSYCVGVVVESEGEAPRE